MAGMKSIPLPEVLELLRSLPVKYAAIVAIGVTTGCRISELLALRRFDLIDRDGNFRDRISFLLLKKKKKKCSTVHRKLRIPEDFRPFVAEHLNRDARKGYERPDHYVFRGKCGRHLTRQTVYRMFRNLLGEGHGTHWMRKTFAQLIFHFFLRDNPADPMRALELTRKALAHERIDTTVKYLGITEAAIDTAQNAIFTIKDRHQ